MHILTSSAISVISNCLTFIEKVQFELMTTRSPLPRQILHNSSPLSHRWQKLANIGGGMATGNVSIFNKSDLLHEPQVAPIHTARRFHEISVIKKPPPIQNNRSVYDSAGLFKTTIPR